MFIVDSPLGVLTYRSSPVVKMTGGCTQEVVVVETVVHDSIYTSLFAPFYSVNQSVNR